MSDYSMIFQQSCHRTMHDLSQNESFGTGGLCQLLTIVMCHRSDKMYWQVGAVVWLDIVFKELPEIVGDELPKQWVVQMLPYI